MHRFTNCSLCSLVYAAREAGRNSRRPLLLDCGHTFCEACLNHLVKDQKGLIACPTCQAEICLQFFESNTKSLCQDIYMTGMIILEQKNVLEKQFNKTFKRRNSSHEKTIKKVKCAECCSNRAACRCMQCNVPLCRICFAKVHSSSVTLKMHQSITLNEDVVKSEDEEMEPAICKLHSNRPLEYYCEEDSALICSRCALLGDHKGHSITAIEEKNRSTLIEIENAMRTAVIVAKKLRRTDKVLSTSSPDICEESFTLVQEIHAHFHHLHGQLQVRERRLIEKAYEMFRFSLPQEDMHSVVREQLKELEAAIKAGQRLLNQSSEPAVNATRICNKLQGSYKIPCCLTLDDTVTDDCSFRFEPGELLTEKINCYGDIVGSPKSKYILYTLSEISEELLDEDVDTLSSVSYTSENNQLFAEDVFEEKIDSHDMRSLKAESDDADRKQVLCRPHLLRRKNLGHNERVVVTHIKNPCQFMIQKCADFIAIQNLSKQINSWCIANKNLAQHLVTSVEVGDYVLAQYSQDNTWYRACVKTVLPRMTVDCDGDGQNTESVEVFYVDYGNSEIQTLDRLLKIQKRYMKNSGFAYECSLYDITSALEDGTWSPETLQLFAKMTSKKPLLMMVIKEIHNVYHVDLSKPPDSYIRDDRPVSVRDALIFLEHAKFITAASAPLLGGPKLIPSRSYPKSEPRRVGEVLDVITTYLNGPDDFFVQKLGEEYLYLSNLMAKMQKQYNTGNNDLWAMYCPQKDMICSCLCEEDGYWYRVKVIGLPGHQQVEVCFVDFGMVSHVSYTSLRKLLDEFLILPVQAIHCRLADVEPLDGTQGWCEEANNWLKKRLQLQQHTVKVVGVGGSYIAVVAYESSMQSSLNHQLVKKGFAKSTGKWSEKVETLEKQCVPLKNNSSSSRCEANMKKEASSEVPPPGTQTNQQVVAVNAQDEKEPLVEVKLSHFESPAKFFVQVMLDLKKLDSLLEELAAEYAESEPSWVTWELGTYCAVKCPETDQWYRAKISQVILKELIEVYLVDFGNTFQVSTTSLRPLKEQFSILPRFAITCHLASYTPAGGKKEWTQTACEFIQEELRNKKYFIIKRGDVTDGSLPVDLLIEDEIPETALEPSSKIYSSLGKKIQEQGLAIPLRRKNSMLKETSDGADGSVKAQSSFQAAASVWKPHPIPSSSITYVVPSYIDDTGIIYAMEYSEGEDALQALSDKIKLHYKNTSRPPDDYQWTVGKSCLGYFEADQVWARATVKRIIGDKIEVHYIDYGNSQLLPADKLRADVHHVIDVPPLTLTLVLDVVPKSVDGKWPKEVIQYIHDAIVGNVCAVQVVRVPKVGAVEVKLVVGEDRELGISLCKMGNACHKQNMLHLAEQSQKICQTLKHSNPYKLLHLPEIGEYFPVLITHIELPNIVYFQNAHTPKEDSWSQVVNAQLTELEQLSVELNTFGPNAAILKDLQPGQICCAQFTFDHCWYRGLVISCDIMNEALVLYVDYGTSEYVSLDKIKKLSPEFQDLPAQAMHCMLYALHPPENAKIWSIQAMNCIIETTTNKELVACIKDKSTPPSIELYSSVPALSDNSVVYKPLVDKGLACFHEPPNCKLEQTANHCAPVEAENEGNVAEPGLMVDAGNAGCQMNKAKIDLEEIDGSLG